jgi:transcriptional regulator with XRE-family HTH domain
MVKRDSERIDQNSPLRPGTHMPDGKVIRQLRTRNGMRQDDLAALAKVSKRTIERIESGAPTTITVLGLVAKALEVQVERILAGEPDAHAKTSGEDQGVSVAGGTCNLEITISRDFAPFTEEEKRRLIEAIGAFLGESARDIKITKAKPG